MRGRKAERYKFRGKMLTMDELADLSSWSKTELRRRIKGKGMSVVKAVQPLKADLRKPKPVAVKTYDYKGRQYTLAELSREVGIPRYTLKYRLDNWEFEEAIKPGKRVKPGSRYLTAMTPDGPVTMTMMQWSVYRDIDFYTISQRKTRKWTDDQALGYAPPPSRSRKKDQP